MVKRPGSATDPLWYKDAIIYELHVRAFMDSNNDGIGDFPGLVQKLDYLQDLGVTCLWLLPFFPSPLRDDGYDIADYLDVHPELRHAGRLPGLPPGGSRAWSPGGDRAGDQPHLRSASLVPARPPGAAGFARARLLRLERHRPEVPRRAHHLHRHREVELDLGSGGQGLLLAPVLLPPARPQLRQSAVVEEIVKAMRFWLDMGVDGLRLDAIPYLVERDGTNCENLPETHVLIKAIRAEMDRNYANRMILAEANQWPTDVAPLLRRWRRMPHGVPLSADAADLHGAPPGGPAPDHGHHGADARRFPTPASGGCSCATTTS